MLFVGIDQHKRYLTICVRDEQGAIVQRRQVSTRWADVDRFLEGLQKRGQESGGYVAMLEVCGFNGWLIQRLAGWGCERTYVISAPPVVRKKTDRRDAARLSELLWINRDRIRAGVELVHVSVVYQPTAEEQYDRQLVHLRHRLGGTLTGVKNRMQGILRRHNLEQACPTKGTFTKAGLGWLREVALPELDRMEMNVELIAYDFYAGQVAAVDVEIRRRALANRRVGLVRTIPKIGWYTGLALVAHIGPIERFPSARSLANFFGVTPGCRNSGESDRPGSITKAGHPLVRFLLGQMVLHALRNDAGLRAWYRQVKRRRGSKIARVAVMRRLCGSIWHVLKKEEPYRLVGSRRAAARSTPSRSVA
jgi:transposase